MYGVFTETRKSWNNFNHLKCMVANRKTQYVLKDEHIHKVRAQTAVKSFI